MNTMALQPPTLDILTLKQYDHGYAINNVHQVQMRHREATLKYFELPMELHCRSCDRRVEHGELYGDASYANNGRYCTDCLKPIPSDIRAVRIIYSMKRKNRHHPDGRNSVTAVNFDHQIRKYIETVFREYGSHGDLTIKELYPVKSAVLSQFGKPQYILSLQTRLDDLKGALLITRNPTDEFLQEVQAEVTDIENLIQNESEE